MLCQAEVADRQSPGPGIGDVQLAWQPLHDGGIGQGTVQRPVGITTEAIAMVDAADPGPAVAIVVTQRPVVPTLSGGGRVVGGYMQVLAVCGCGSLFMSSVTSCVVP